MKSLDTCPNCQSTKLHFLFSSKDRMFQLPGSFALNECSVCHVWILSPRPAEKELSKYYPVQKYYSYTNRQKGLFTIIREYLVYHQYHPTIISSIISMLIHPVPALPRTTSSRKILDVGCGTGDTLILLQKIGWKTYGLEIDKKAVNIARKRGLKNVTYGGYRDMEKYQNNYFDTIRLYHVIEHLDDPTLCLKLIFQKLKPEGEVIIGTPNSASIAAGVFKTYWYNLDSPRHLLVFRPHTLKQLAQKAGFKNIEIEFCSAGGIIGSIQYILEEKFSIRLNLIHQPLLVMLFYPIEWVLDHIRQGDVFVLRAFKN